MNPFPPSIHEILADLQRKLSAELKSASLSVYTLSTEATCFRDGPYSWEVKLHFDDPASESGVRHVLLGEGKNLPEDDFELIATWTQKTGEKLKVKRPVSISVFDLS